MSSGSTFVLIPGAGSGPWTWEAVADRLRRAGHEAIAVDLPCEDPSAGLGDYADVTVGALGERRDPILVAQSLGAFTAALVATRVPVAMLVYVNAMIPIPGESPGAWWGNTGWEEAVRDELERYGKPSEWGPEELSAMFMNDASSELAQEAGRHARAQSGAPFEDALPQQGWPTVPTRYVLARADRFFPAAFQRRLVRERLGIEADEIDGAHVAMRTNPGALVALLERYAAPAEPGTSDRC
jgi:pimeloyl-ACP methyl ester carboxylesterase